VASAAVAVADIPDGPTGDVRKLSETAGVAATTNLWIARL